MPTESPRARQAWADYLALGPDRSLEKLLHRYQSESGAGPTSRLATLKQWSHDYGWQARLQAIADGEVADAEERQRQHIRDVMETGFALPHERVKLLKQLGETLATEVTGERRWLPDKKSIITGQEPVLSDDGARVIGSVTAYDLVELERFNAAEVAQLRGILDDIAKETGGRVQKSELTGKNGGPIEVKDADLTDAELADRLLGVLARTRAPEPDPPAGG